MTALADIVAPFIEMAHRIVWCTVATVDPSGRPRTRVLHPIWAFEDGRLTGWIATSPGSPKAAHLDHIPEVSLTYWEAGHDTCSADCSTTWELDEASRRAGWDRFASAPEPVGYDPSIVAPWTDPMAEAFGLIRLEPHRLRLMPGSLMLRGEGELLTWSAGS